MTFIAFVFSLILWLPNGSYEVPIVRAYPNMELCLAAQQELMADVQESLEDSSPAMLLSYHLDTCRLVTNTSRTDKD